MILSESSNLIFKKRYAIHEDEMWQGLSERVAQGGAQIEGDFRYWQDVFAADIYNMLFLPGGRILRNVGRPRGSLFNCLSRDTDILTEDGFVRIDKLKDGDKILNGNGEFSTVKKVFENGYKEKLIEFHIYGFGQNTIKSTYDHKFKIFDFKKGIKWKTANEINTDTDFMVIPKIKSNEKINFKNVSDVVNINELYPDKEYVIDNNYIKFLNKRKKDNEYNQQISYIKNNIIISKEFCRLVGYYLSEGTSINNGNSIIFSFHENEIKYIEDVILLIKNIFGLDSIIRDNKGKSKQVCVNSQILNQFFANLFGRKSKDKKLPWWWYSLDNDYLTETLVGCIRGDGSLFKGKRGITSNFRVSNKLLSYQIFMIGNKLEIATGFTVSKNRKIKAFDNEYISSIWSANFGTLKTNTKLICRLNDFLFNDDYCVFPIKEKNEIDYNDYVYDISMEDYSEPHFSLIGAVVHNCYVEPLDDSMEQIGDFQKNCGVLWSEGGGVGCNASFLRPENAPIIQKGGESSGPISFLKWANAGANCIKTGGARRAAALAMMNVNHPDIFNFINAKLVDGELNCFNISAAVTEDFLQAVEANDDWDLVWKTKVWRTVKAREIWDLILNNMVECAEPGLINWDNLRSNNSYYFDPILCFTGDTLISTTDGLIQIKDLVDKKINTISDLRVIGSQGTFIEDGIGFRSGIKEVFEIKLQNNQKIKLTDNHKVWTKDGWKEVKNLKVKKDYMYVQNSISQHFVNNLENEEEFDNGYLLGLLVGDGWICKSNNTTQYGFCFNENEEDMMNFVETKINNLILSDRHTNWHRSSNGSKSFELTTSSKDVVEYFKRWGYYCDVNEYGYMRGTRRSSKFISDEILQESPSFKRGFISGLYDSDGHVQRVGKGNTGKGKKITLVTSKKHMAERIQIMLNEFGIPSSIGSRISKLNEKLFTAYTVNISRKLSCMAFKKLIGSKHSEKSNILNDYEFGSIWNEKYYGMFKVKSIKSLGEQEVYDVETSVTHSLIANGIVVHNSTNPCFSNDSKILTKQGHFEIQDLVDKEVDIWDGDNWITINNFRITGENQKMLKITLYDGSEIRVTPYHKFYIEGNSNPKEAKELKEGDKLTFSNAPLVHGNIKEKGAYVKGFLLGDGSIKRDNEPLLRLYEPKYCCEKKLIESTEEIQIENINTNAIEQLEFNYEEGNDRKNLTGLTVRKNNLHKWCNEYKNKLPKEVFQWNLKSKCEFLAGFFDADGSIMDNEKAYGYQVWANSKKMLQDIQLLLKTIGVQSKLSLGKKAGKKDFNDGYGEYDCKTSYRLTISQRYSIELSKLVKFIRLKDFSDRKVKYNIKDKFNMIVSIEEDGIDEKVYCCTVPNTHKVSLSLGILTGQCGEVPLGAHGVCCLGSLVLPNFITGIKNTNWQLMEKVVHNAIRFLDNIIQINRYVIGDVKRKAFDGRRIGLGVMGLAEYLFAKNVRYGSKDSIRVINTLMENIRNFAYEASCKIAEEKEPFPKFDVKEYSKAHFFKTLPASLRMDIKKHGIRNVTVMAVAPTGCQDKNTIVITNKGILTLEEIGNINGEEWQDIDMKVSQEHFEKERDATKFYINGKANTKKIYLKSGNTLESTYNHQYRVLEDGNYIWKRADELNIGDDIVSVLYTYNKTSNPDLHIVEITHGNQNNINPIFSMNEKLAEFLGIYFGDGSNHKKGIRIHCNANNEDEYLYVAELGKEIFGIEPTFYDNKRNCISVCFNSQLILKFLELNGLLKQKSNNITIPKIIRISSRSCIEAFIKGLIFADGSKSGNNIYLDTASKRLSKELLVIIRALGNDVRIQPHTSGFGSEMFRVWIKTGIYKYRSLHEQKKKRQLESLDLDTCIVDEVIEIENSENYTYDIEVPSTVTYIANSVVSHNTISLIPEVTSSIEPLPYKAYLRHDEVSDRAYIHPIYKKIIESNKATPDWYVDSTDLTPQDHFEVQVAVQKYLDGSVSKTIICPKGFKTEQLSDLLLEYIRDLKGVTLYVDGSREGQILNPMTKKDARKYMMEGKEILGQEERDCSTGACEI